MSRQLLSFYISALAITGVGVLGSALIPRAHANGRDKMTVVNVNERISANNKVLDPGTYVCKLDSRAALDFLLSDSHRHLTWRPRDRRSLPTSANISRHINESILGQVQTTQLNSSAIVHVGVDEWTLSRAVGHLPYTALPGHIGNFAIAANRDTFLRDSIFESN